MRPKTCDTCLMPMEIMMFEDKLTFGCENPSCYKPEFVEVKIQSQLTEEEKE